MLKKTYLLTFRFRILFWVTLRIGLHALMLQNSFLILSSVFPLCETACFSSCLFKIPPKHTHTHTHTNIGDAVWCHKVAELKGRYWWVSGAVFSVGGRNFCWLGLFLTFKIFDVQKNLWKGWSPLTLSLFYSSFHLLLVNFTQFPCLDPGTHLISVLLPSLSAPFLVLIW